MCLGQSFTNCLSIKTEENNHSHALHNKQKDNYSTNTNTTVDAITTHTANTIIHDLSMADTAISTNTNTTLITSSTTNTSHNH